ncbi:MAG: cation:dicarboxylase symporter family transporter [Treponema sp.]|nr:cation:dicarboxylase symporter family transporter [Treponema sp.]
MKVWIKYLLGVILGIVAAFILPLNNTTASEVLTFLTELFIRFGRYFVVPIVFSTAVVAINKLRLSKQLLRTSLWTLSIIVISAFMFTLIGIVSILIVKLPRIPITVDSITPSFNLDIKSIILSLFPESAFDALKEGSFLLVPFLFGSLIGWESASEQNVFKPVYGLADSLSQLFYNISVFFTEIMSVMLVAIMCNWTITFREVFATGIYTPVIIMLLCDFIIIVGIIYPLIIRYLCHDPHPYKVLYASIAPMILAFVSGDSNLVLPLNIRHGKESLGIRRRCGGFTYPLFSIFARGGSSLVAAISFILIWRSYSSLPIPASDVFWLFLISFGISFLLGGIPSGGAFILITIICERYGKGFETSFLLLKPAALIFCSFASILDAATAMFGSYIVAVKTKLVEHHQIHHFI